MNLHERIVLELASRLRVNPPKGMVRTHLNYDLGVLLNGEIDVHKRWFLKDGVYVADYEVKSHACPRNVDKAFRQLSQAERYWRTHSQVKRVNSFLAYGLRNDNGYAVVPFSDGHFFFESERRFDFECTR